MKENVPYLDIKCCPDCGGDVFGLKVTMSGQGKLFYMFKGEKSDNTHLHDHLKYKQQKTAYCEDCGKKLGAVKYKEVEV